MERTLSIQEVQQVFTFLDEKGVYYYDLQIEMVDHLATSIEEKWKEDPTLKIVEVLEQEYPKFDLVEDEKRFKYKKSKIQWSLFKAVNLGILSVLNSSKVIVVLLLVVLFSQLLQSVAYTFDVLAYLYTICFLVLLVGMIQHWKFNRKHQQKLLFIESQFHFMGNAQSLLLIPMFWLEPYTGTSGHLSFWWAQFFGVLTCYVLLFTYEMVFVQLYKNRSKARQMIVLNRLVVN